MTASNGFTTGHTTRGYLERLCVLAGCDGPFSNRSGDADLIVAAFELDAVGEILGPGETPDVKV